MYERHEIKAVYDSLLKHFQNGNDALATQELRLFIESAGVETFHNNAIETCLTVDEVHFSASSLWYAATCGFVEFASELIRIQVDIDIGTRCSSNPGFDQQSPLMAACESGNITMIRLLLDSGANLMHRTSSGMTVLWKISDVNVCALIIEKAIELQCLYELLACLHQSGQSIFHHCLAADQLDIFNMLLQHELLKLQANFDSSEDQAMAGIERLYNINPETILVSEPILSLSDRNETPLYYAAKHDYRRLAKRLIELGVDPDKGVTCEDVNHGFHLSSPLIAACANGHLEMCQLLLTSGANILHVSSQGFSALMLASRFEIVQRLLADSRDKNCLPNLVSLKSQNSLDAGTYQCNRQNSQSVHELMAIPNFHQMLDIVQMLREARLTSAKSKEKSAEFDVICDRLQVYVKEYAVLHLNAQLLTSHHHFGLFQQSPSLGSTLSFEETKTLAIQSIIASYYQLLRFPHECMPYLQFLNDELKRYYENKHQESFPVLCEPVEYKKISDLYYPVPGPEYKGIKKHRALAELLVALFRKYGLAEQAYKWIGFIPNEKADEHVKKGYFFTEGTYGTGLVHGKLAHMIQRAILIYAVEQGRVDRTFVFNSERHLLDFKDIFGGLVSMKTPDKETLWARVQDERMHNNLQFTDPYQLISIIMFDGRHRGLTALADSLTDSFCKGLIAYFKAYRAHTPFTDIDISRFIRHIQDLTLNYFSFNPALFNAEVREVLQKRGLQVETIDTGIDYALPPKSYEPDSSFYPCDYKYRV